MRAAQKRPLTAATVSDQTPAPQPQPRFHSKLKQIGTIRQDDISSQLAGVYLPVVVEAAGVALTQKGHRCIGLCPFHTEKTASFCVSKNAGKWRFKCFGCGVGGDALDFVQKAYGLDFKDALGHLGLRPSRMTPELSFTIQRNKKGASLISSFRKWVDRQIDVACFIIHTCNRLVQKIKTPSDMERYGKFYHLLVKAEYHHSYLCKADDEALYRLFREGGLYE